MKSSKFLAVVFVLMFGFIAFGSSSSFGGFGGFSRSIFVFQGVPTFPAISWQPSFVSFTAIGGFAPQPVFFAPSRFRFVFLDP